MNALVTGCSKGLGLDITKKLVSLGHSVTGIARAEPKELIENFQFLKLDLANYTTKNCWQKIIDHMNLDLLILNAARGHGALSLDNEEPGLLALNYISPMTLAKAAIHNSLAKNRKLKIIGISSISAHRPMRGLGEYAASKAALEIFLKNVAYEFHKYGISTINICPDYFYSEMTAPIFKSNLLHNEGPHLSSNEIANWISTELEKKKLHWKGESVLLSHRKKMLAPRLDQFDGFDIHNCNGP